jgi:hypothetical protein
MEWGEFPIPFENSPTPPPLAILQRALIIRRIGLCWIVAFEPSLAGRDETPF